MRITEEFKLFVEQLSGWQRVKLVLVVVVVLGLMLSGWMDSCRTMREVKRHEREAAVAKRDAAEHIERADKLGKQAAKIAAELKISEEKRNEAEQNLKIAASRSADARAAYELVRGNRSPDTPTADALCKSLAELGYACE